MALYVTTITATFECHESDTDEQTEKAVKALEALGFTNVIEDDLDEEPYDLTEKQAVEQFEENVLPSLITRYGADDAVAIRTAYNDYTDSLCKDGQLTTWQYENMDNPY
jgi:hypothetical protein